MQPKLLQTIQAETNNSGQHAKPVAYLLLFLGGTAFRALNTFARRFTADGQPFHKRIVYVDTDPLKCPLADAVLHIGISREEAVAIRANPRVFGPACDAIVTHYPRYLEPESSEHGSRTMRMLTQASVEVHWQKYVDAVQRAILTLVKESGCKTVLPILASSTGGGFGSAMVCVAAKLFMDADFRSRVTEGLNPQILSRPIAVVTEPFAYALNNKEVQANKILANAFAFRVETAFLEHQGALQYVFHCGLANAGGTVLDAPEGIARALGGSIYALCRDYGYLKDRWVDTDDNRLGPYSGQDRPESHLPAGDHPPYAAQQSKKPIGLRNYSVCNDRLMRQFRKETAHGNGKTR